MAVTLGNRLSVIKAIIPAWLVQFVSQTAIVYIMAASPITFSVPSAAAYGCTTARRAMPILSVDVPLATNPISASKPQLVIVSLRGFIQRRNGFVPLTHIITSSLHTI